MKRALQGITLAIIVGSSFLITGCTTEQRSGRTTGEYIDDKTLNTRVRGALDDSAEYKFPDVKVESFRGTVQLSGFVATAAQKGRAGEIAKNVRGVANVDNKISVK
jgi:osmotically-inducible protein OsmY